jgi:molybdopterin converting factor small subunit
LIDHLNGLNNQYKHAFAKRSLIKIAVNKNYSPFETKINNNDEVAFFPPVTGG